MPASKHFSSLDLAHQDFPRHACLKGADCYFDFSVHDHASPDLGHGANVRTRVFWKKYPYWKAKISKLTRSMWQETGKVLRDVLGPRWPRAGSTEPNVQAAVRELGGSEADRRMIHALIFEPPRQLQDRVFVRVIRLLARVDPSAARRLSDRYWTREARAAVRAAIEEARWIEPASPLELAQLLREPGEHQYPPELHRPVRAALDRIPAIREDPEVARALEGFRDWARKKGHDRWLVQLSLRRALGPLLGSVRTGVMRGWDDPAKAGAWVGGIMRGWEDLSRPARRRYVKAALKLEKELLGPEPAGVRARERFPSADALQAIKRT